MIETEPLDHRGQLDEDDLSRWLSLSRKASAESLQEQTRSSEA